MRVNIEGIPCIKGSYCLIYQLHETISTQIGKLGKFDFQPGFYLYFGSAKGVGGLRARIKRHLYVQQKKFWHIDYLKTYLTPMGFFYSNQIDKECEWAQFLHKSEKFEIPVINFGSSDCKKKCGAHLLMTSNSDLDLLKEIITHSDCNFDQLIFLSGKFQPKVR